MRNALRVLLVLSVVGALFAAFAQIAAAAQSRASLPVTVAVERWLPGAGTVTSDPPGIACGATCRATFNGGGSVTLHADAAPGSYLAGWRAGCASVTPGGDCVVSLDVSKVVVAKFELDPKLIVVTTAGGSVSGAVTCAAASTCFERVPFGSVAALAATPAPGFAFVGWTGACTGSSSDCAVTMAGSRGATARFAQATLTVEKWLPGTGVVTSAPGGIFCGFACRADFPLGTVVLLHAEPNPGSVFSGWVSGCSSVNPAGDCFVTLDSSRRVIAKFNLATRPVLTVAVMPTADLGRVTGPNGINCPSGACSAAIQPSVVTIHAIAAPGYMFDHWDGPCAGQPENCDVVLGGDRSAAAWFVPIPLGHLQFAPGRGVSLEFFPASLEGTTFCTGGASWDAIVDECPWLTYPVGTTVTVTARGMIYTDQNGPYLSHSPYLFLSNPDFGQPSCPFISSTEPGVCTVTVPNFAVGTVVLFLGSN